MERSNKKNPEDPSQLLVFDSTTTLNDLVSLICEKSNVYAAQNGRLLQLLKKFV